MASLRSFPLCELVQWDYHPHGDSPYTAVSGFRGREPISAVSPVFWADFFEHLQLQAPQIREDLGGMSEPA